MPSPIKESIQSLPPPMSAGGATLHPPPSPGTHRTLRKLQSAHNLGAKASYNPSIISQQRFHLQQHQQQHSQVSSATSPARRYPPITHRSPQRARANSDAPPPLNQVHPSAWSTKSVGTFRTSALAAGMPLEKLLRDGPPEADVVSCVNGMRLRILDAGVKSDGDGMSGLRIYAWLTLLNCSFMDTDGYLTLVHRGASPAYSKIRNDTFRTLTTDPLFRRRVSEASLIRLLNAIAWKLHDTREDKGVKQSSSRQSLPHIPETPTNISHSKMPTGCESTPSSPSARNRARALTLTTEGSESGVNEPGTYVQGMNVLAAPFLYAARSEAEAFVAFHHLLTKECPGYIRGAMDGVHKGLALVDKVLAIMDSSLSTYLLSKNLSAEIYAFPSVLTLCACTPPLPEVLKLWDFLFAYGPHLNILCIVAQVLSIKDELHKSPSPNKLLRSFPPLQADLIKNMTISIIHRLPNDIYAEIVEHAK